MELDFDKEIDAMLRNARRDGPVYVGDQAVARHLDADEIAAFAENAMPEKGRALYTAHLADCDRCRKVLSNLLMMNAEAAPAASLPGAITIAERDLPWYRKLFLFPNLAYLMGSLVLVFGGFLAVTIVQNSGMGDSAIVSQVSENETTASGPNFETGPAFPDQYAANTNANAAANIASTSTALAANSNASVLPSAAGERGPQAETAMRDDRGASLDATVGAADPAPPPAAMAAPKDADAKERDDEQAKAKAEDKVAGNVPQEAFKNDAMLQRQQSGVAAQSGPMRNNENQYNRQIENMDRRAAAKRVARSEEETAGRRVVGGRTFERKQRVWYDTAYQGHPTINVRRETDEFNRLDAGLRSIANKLSGTIVVVWGAKAYRIQ